MDFCAHARKPRRLGPRVELAESQVRECAWQGFGDEEVGETAVVGGRYCMFIRTCDGLDGETTGWVVVFGFLRLMLLGLSRRTKALQAKS